ncbi:MAG: GIY-YIG nuclease family protein, partial [Bacteroidetes bacterium]|nr:GIY-YIG nuclease family protein [Bacteroidota bacterium]
DYTKNKGPWELVFIQEFQNKKDALVREKSLKRANSKYLLWVIQQPYNIFNQFI